MITLKVNDLKLFENLLCVISRYQESCQFEVSTKCTKIFCRDPFNPDTALLLDTDSLVSIDEDVKFSIKDVSELKSAISLTLKLDGEAPIELSLNMGMFNGENIAKSISYEGQSGWKFKINTVLPEVIESFIFKDLQLKLNDNIEFTIDPERLNIIQKHSQTIVNSSDTLSAHVHFNRQTNQVSASVSDINSENSNYIALPIGSISVYADKVSDECNIMIKYHALSILNIFNVTDKSNLQCIYNDDYTGMVIKSSVKNGDYSINSRLVVSGVA